MLDGNIFVNILSVNIRQFSVNILSVYILYFNSPPGPAHPAGEFRSFTFGHPFSPFFRPKFWIHFRRRFWLKNGSLLEPKMRPNVPKWCSTNVSPQRRVQKSVFGRYLSDFGPLQSSWMSVSPQRRAHFHFLACLPFCCLPGPQSDKNGANV